MPTWRMAAWPNAHVTSRQQGLRMLLAQPGLTVRAMSEQDWQFLVSLCDRSVQQAYARRGADAPPFTRVHTQLRAKLDAHIGQFIALLAPRDSSGGSDQISESDQLSHSQARMLDALPIQTSARRADDHSA